MAKTFSVIFISRIKFIAASEMKVLQKCKYWL